MDKSLWRLAVLLFVLGFGIFYGVSLSKHGIEQINGPIVETEADSTADVQQTPPPEAPSEQATATTVQPPVNQGIFALFDKIGSLLNKLADGLVHLIVRLGEAILS